MNNKLFRKNSLKKVSSPDQLVDYIKVSKPGIWIVVVAMLLLMIGAAIWGTLGRLETKLDVVAVSDGNDLICYIPEKNVSSIEEGMEVRIGDEEFHISDMSADPVAIYKGEMDEYTMHLGNLQDGEWVYTAEIDGIVKKGSHPAEIITNSVSPISFILN